MHRNLLQNLRTEVEQKYPKFVCEDFEKFLFKIECNPKIGGHNAGRFNCREPRTCSVTVAVVAKCN